MKKRARIIVLMFGVMVMAAMLPVAQGINIVPVFNAGSSDAPSFDPTGSSLIALFDFAEAHYQDIFEDSHTITINFWYDDLNNNTLGQHSLVSQSGGRENEANIRIDTKTSGGATRNWFIDSTPSNNSEFDMEQTLWRDLSGTQKGDWYTGWGGDVVPETFEVGYTGQANSAPAQGRTDMLSVILHEVGHALGMSASNTATVAETNDGDYDFDSNFVFGATFSIETANDSGDDNDNIAHVEDTNALMTPSIPSGRRRLPSHSDLFAMARVHNYEDLDVPRREFYGNTNWQNNSNWSGDAKPGAADDVYVRDAEGDDGINTVRLTSANGVAKNIFLSEAANIDTDAFKLDVGGDVTITGLDTDMFINPGGELEADEVFIKDQAEIEMTGGLLDVRRLVIDSGTQIEVVSGGSATVDVSSRLVNNGEIDTRDNSTFNFTSAAATPWDLDGGGDGIVRADAGNIFFLSGGMSDSFDGEIEVGSTKRFHFAQAWTNSTGLFDLNGGATFNDRARMTGGKITFNGGQINANVGGTASQNHIDAAIDINGGTITVGLDDRLEFNGTTLVAGGVFNLSQDGNVQFDGATSVSGGTFNTQSDSVNDGVVEFDGVTTYLEGSITVHGSARQDGDATVSGVHTITADLFDMDGTSGTNAKWTINRALTINTHKLDTSNNNYDGELNITNNGGLIIIGGGGGGSLTINLPGNFEWTMDGVANLDGSLPGPIFTFIPSLIIGSDVNISGQVNAKDRSNISARADVSGTVTTTDATSLIRFTGGTLGDPNTMVGGLLNGPGKVGSTTDHALVGYGTIDMTIAFSGNSELRAKNGTLLINGTLEDVGTIGTASPSGILNVSYVWNAMVADQVELKGGRIIGSRIINGSATDPALITGYGLIATTQVNNHQTIAAKGGTLIIDTVNAPDLDGGGNGIIEAMLGNLTINDKVIDDFDGTANVGVARTLRFVDGWKTGPTSTLNLTGASPANRASIRGTEQLLRGTQNIDKEVGFYIKTEFAASSSTNLNDANDILRFFDDTRIRSGADFNGLGKIVNVAAGPTIRFDDGVSLGVRVENFGRMEIGNSPGTVKVAEFLQAPLGLLQIEIGGVVPGVTHDLLVVSNDVFLNGTLEIDLFGPYVPVFGHIFDVLDWGGTLTGAFDSMIVAPLPGDMAWNTVNLYTDGTIMLGLLGDVNGDGLVNGFDVDPFVDILLNGPFNPAADMNQDGSINGFDVDPFVAAVLGNGPTQIDITQIPEPATLALFAIGGGLMLIRRRRHQAA